MAEVALGVVSGGFVVASLALQMAETSQKLHAFWQSFGSANSDAERIKHHLSILQAISAAVVDICKQQSHIPCEAEAARSIEVCKVRIESVTLLLPIPSEDKDVKRIEKYWFIFKVTLKMKTVKYVESQLRGALEMLLLDLQPFFQ